MSDVHVPSRPCDRCGDKWPLDEMLVMEAVCGTDNVWYRGKVCPTCVALIQMATRLGFMQQDMEVWYRAP